MKIIVVDDDNLMLDYYKEVLRSTNYDVTYCNSPFSALNEIFKCSYDLIITDLKMPLKSGTEMIDFIREALDENNIPVIVISGYIQDEIAATLKKMQGVTLMEKPVGHDDLVNTIKNALPS